MEKGKFIVIEGIDGSGKSTIARLLKKEYNLLYYHSPCKEYKIANQYVHMCDPYTQLCYYMGGNFDISHKIQESLTGHNILCDKFFYTTVVSFMTFTGASTKRVEELVGNLTRSLLQPDCLLYLTLDSNIRTSRLNERDVKGKIDKQFEKNIAIQLKAEENFQKYLSEIIKNYHIIDTGCSIEETMSHIRPIINKLLQVDYENKEK